MFVLVQAMRADSNNVRLLKPDEALKPWPGSWKKFFRGCTADMPTMSHER